MSAKSSNQPDRSFSRIKDKTRDRLVFQKDVSADRPLSDLSPPTFWEKDVDRLLAALCSARPLLIGPDDPKKIWSYLVFSQAVGIQGGTDTDSQ